MIPVQPKSILNSTASRYNYRFSEYEPREDWDGSIVDMIRNIVTDIVQSAIDCVHISSILHSITTGGFINETIDWN